MKDKDWESLFDDLFFRHELLIGEDEVGELKALLKSTHQRAYNEAIQSYKEELIKDIDHKISDVSGFSKSDMSCNIRANCYSEIIGLIKSK